MCFAAWPQWNSPFCFRMTKTTSFIMPFTHVAGSCDQNTVVSLHDVPKHPDVLSWRVLMLGQSFFWGSIIFWIMGSKHRGLPTWACKTSLFPFLAFVGCGAKSVTQQLVHHFCYKIHWLLMIFKLFYSMAQVKLTLLFQKYENVVL